MIPAQGPHSRKIRRSGLNSDSGLNIKTQTLANTLCASPSLEDVCPQPEVRELLPASAAAKSFPRVSFTWRQSMSSRKEARSLLAWAGEPHEWCGAALHVS